MPLALDAYRCLTQALAPAVPLLLAQRARKGKEDPLRLRERLGYASLPRPTGELIWLHGASVGECLSALPLIGALLEVPDRYVLLTSGTVTSAALLSDRLPPRAFHQYAPVDYPGAVRRFLDWWRPAGAFFIDSELWPNLLRQLNQRNIPAGLINGRMSARSFGRWRKLRSTSAALLRNFDLCLVQDSDSAERLSALGAPNLEISGNLKADAPPLLADNRKLDELTRAIAQRPILLAASTHPGEEETLLPAADQLRQTYPNLLTIIAPRHPERGGDIMMLCGARSARRRSTGTLPDSATAVYVADTLGELGLLYRLPAFAFVGGSLVPRGGQNPLEPARLHRAVLAGPYTHNFTPAYEAIFAAQGAGRVIASGEIAALAGRLLANPAEAHAMGEAAAEAALALGGAVRRTRAAMEKLLGHARP